MKKITCLRCSCSFLEDGVESLPLAASWFVCFVSLLAFVLLRLLRLKLHDSLFKMFVGSIMPQDCITGKELNSEELVHSTLLLQ